MYTGKSTISRYAELRSALDLNSAQMSEYFKVKSVQGQSSQGKAWAEIEMLNNLEMLSWLVVTGTFFYFPIYWKYSSQLTDIHPASRGGAAHTASLFWIVTRTHTHIYVYI